MNKVNGQKHASEFQFNNMEHHPKLQIMIESSGNIQGKVYVIFAQLLLVTQMAKSSEVNLLDLSFSRTLQSAQWRLGHNSKATVDERLNHQSMEALALNQSKIGRLEFVCYDVILMPFTV